VLLRIVVMKAVVISIQILGSSIDIDLRACVSVCVCVRVCVPCAVLVVGVLQLWHTDDCFG